MVILPSGFGDLAARTAEVNGGSEYSKRTPSPAPAVSYGRTSAAGTLLAVRPAVVDAYGSGFRGTDVYDTERRVEGVVGSGLEDRGQNAWRGVYDNSGNLNRGDSYGKLDLAA